MTIDSAFGYDAAEHARMKSAVTGALTPMMMIDRDLVITFANEATKKLMAQHEATLQSLYPSFSAKKLVGTCIDIFHKHPEHQRRILNDPSNLPYSTDIQVGPLKFRINVTAIFNQGEFVGCNLEWQDVTEIRKKESAIARMEGAVMGAMTPMMMIDRDLVITYSNNATMKLMEQHEATLQSLYPSFSAKKLVGTCIDIFHKHPEHQRRILNDPSNLPYSTDIQVGPLKFRINVSAIFEQGEFIGCSLEWQDVTQIRKREERVARLTGALEGLTTNLMMCDENLDIIYCNPAVVQMLKENEAELRKVLPSFNADRLVGSNIDQFHRHPEHQRGLLKDASRLPFVTTIKVGKLQFKLNATYIQDDQGFYLGNCVEWMDVTQQMQAQDQINELIQGAIEGRIDARVDTGYFDGFPKAVGEGINAILDAVMAPIQETNQVMAQMADGQLDVRMTGDYQGQFAALAEAVNDSITNVHRTINDIRQAVDTITTATSEISRGNTDLSKRTEEQSSSLEETASSMEQLAEGVKQNAENTRQANQLAAGAREKAEDGGEVVGKAVSAMSEIHKSSKKIADIIGVIDEIAFQTNLLALNAAVEAARAGEQGRGFAVVASEVRNLAQRSASAAKEIKALINDSVDKVEEGTRLVDASGQTLNTIVESVKKVSDIMGEISAGSHEQATGIDEINKAVGHLDQVTQANGALVEEVTAASESLGDQIRTLERLVAFFKTEDAQLPHAMQAAHQAQFDGPQRPARRSPQRPARQSARPSRSRPAPRPRQDDTFWEEF
ncbi:MAG: methyl-accepting chemotaxis protein [Bradymonadia bacterium]